MSNPVVLASAPALLVAVALLAAEAHAEGGHSCALSWVELPGAEGCGGAVRVARAVEARLGRHAIVSPAQSDLSIEGRVEHTETPARWHAVVAMRRADGAPLGAREFESSAAGCDELRESVTLAVALMIDPDAALGPRPATSAPEPDDEAPPVTEPTPPAAIPPRWHAESGAGVGVAMGYLPSLSVGALVSAFASPPHFWDIEIFGAFWAPQTASAGNGASARLAFVDGGLAVCPMHLEDEHHRVLRLCAGAQLGTLQATGDGFAVTHGGTGTAFDALGAAHLDVPVVTPLVLRAALTSGVALYRDSFVYTDAQGTQREAFDPSLVRVTGELGLAAAF